MAHIHERIDFAVAVFVVHQAKVLLVHHRQLGKWLPLGGHIELDEDPEAAALREVKEESGLDIELLGERPPTTGPGTRALVAPRFLDIHRISPTHEHIGMIYWARPKAGSSRPDDGRAGPAATANPCELRLAKAEHNDIRWCSAEELDTLQPPLDPSVKWYCLKAIEEISASSWPPSASGADCRGLAFQPTLK
ncbi:MAG: NUDIX domain-containing protein [Verrucomicrobiae bacterium]|nr:NUDIX domain-containing protein [Verrucomicrobiae bacterium]